MRRFVYQPAPVPVLAWCAEVPRGDGDVRVVHGAGVECRRDFFFEGAWQGDFAAADFVGARVCAGSGARLEQGRPVFAAPSHTCERLHTLRLDDRLLVSNSLPFLLCRAGDGLDPGYAFYGRDIMTLLSGLEDYRRWLPTRDGRRIQLHYHGNLAVGADLALDERPTALHEPFRDYAHYVATLREALADVLANAADPARHTRYAPLTSTSSGYDSAACTLLARDAGCRHSFTVREARPDPASGTAHDDSGTELAKGLGLQVTEFSREDHRRLPDFAEAEFLASGTGGSENVFAPAEPLLRGTVYVSGYVGDLVWSRTALRVRTTLRRRDASGGSLAEFRLRTGFVHLPLPFVGARRHPSIHAISTSDAMAPWSVGGGYDRPIPRRLLEEAGVPRGSFAHAKRATGNSLNAVRGILALEGRPLESYLGEASLADFRAFHARLPRAQAGIGPRLRRRVYRLRYGLPEFVKPWLRRRWVERVADRVGDPRFEFTLAPSDWAFHWAVEKLRPRYELSDSA